MKVVGEVRPLYAVNDRDHVRGPSNASITVVHYGASECLFSREGARVMNMLEERFDGQLRIVFRHFPLTMVKHPHVSTGQLKQRRRLRRRGNSGKWPSYSLPTNTSSPTPI